MHLNDLFLCHVPWTKVNLLLAVIPFTSLDSSTHLYSYLSCSKFGAWIGWCACRWPFPVQLKCSSMRPEHLFHTLLKQILKFVLCFVRDEVKPSILSHFDCLSSFIAFVFCCVVNYYAAGIFVFLSFAMHSYETIQQMISS